MFSRRGILAAAPAALALVSASSSRSAGQADAANVARQRLVVSALFEQLRQAPSQWKLDGLLHDVVTFLDLNNADFGQANGPKDTIKKLMDLRDAGDLDLVAWPGDENVMVAPDWTVFATARRARSTGTIMDAFYRQIAFGFQLSQTPQWEPSKLLISILTVMRPFEPSFSAAREPCHPRR